MSEQKQDQGKKEPAPTQESDAQRVSKDTTKDRPSEEQASEQSGERPD